MLDRITRAAINITTTTCNAFAAATAKELSYLNQFVEKKGQEMKVRIGMNHFQDHLYEKAHARGEEIEVTFIVDGKLLSLVFLRVDGDVDGTAFGDMVAWHEVLAQDAELCAAVHLVGGLFHVVVGQLVDEVFGESCASLEGVALQGHVILDGTRHTLTVALGSQAERVDTSDNQPDHHHRVGFAHRCPRH